ncbi:MAG: IS5/IS1182 family transposase, partial [Microcystaceae cyanobacterium]
MRPALWHPPIELSSKEQNIIKRIRRAKLFVFLRQWRHELFDDDFQQELTNLFQDKPRGQPPIPPAQLALTIMVESMGA